MKVFSSLARIALCCGFALGVPLHVALDHAHEAEHVRAHAAADVIVASSIHCGDCGHSVHCPENRERHGPHHGHQVDAVRATNGQRLHAPVQVFEVPTVSLSIEPVATPSIDNSDEISPVDSFILREINPRGPPSA